MRNIEARLRKLEKAMAPRGNFIDALKAVVAAGRAEGADQAIAQAEAERAIRLWRQSNGARQ